MHPNLSQPSPLVLSGGGQLKGPYSPFPGMQPSDMVKSQSGSHYQPMNGSQPMVYDNQMNQGPGMGSSQLMDSQLIQVSSPLKGLQSGLHRWNKVFANTDWLMCVCVYISSKCCVHTNAVNGNKASPFHVIQNKT